MNASPSQDQRSKRREYWKRYYAENRERILKERRSSYGEEEKQKKKERYNQNREQLLDQKREYYIRNLDSIKEYRERNKARMRLQNRNWHQNNKERCRERKRKTSQAYRQRPEIKLRMAYRRRMNKLLRGDIKPARSLEILGCTLDEFKSHIENQFKPGMTWDNHGIHGWHIDHVIPCSRFDLTDPEHIKRCFHFSNLQPLWAKENLQKSNNLTDPQLRLL